MPGNQKLILCVLVSAILNISVSAQPIQFSHLSIDEGMPTNLTSSPCFDSSGLIWVGSYDGVIGFDGNRMHQYVKETHPQLPLNIIDYLYCDSKNRIWISTDEGLAMLDEHRRLRQIVISDTIANKNIDETIEVPGLGMIAFGIKNTYLLPEGQKTWQPFTWFDQTIRKGSGIARVRKFRDTKIMFLCQRKVWLVDLLSKKTLLALPIIGAQHITRYNDSTLFVVSGSKFELYKISIPQARIIKIYNNVVNTSGDSIRSGIVSSDLAANGMIFITTRANGLVSFNPETAEFQTYKHDPLERFSISSNSLRRVHCHRDGNVLVTSTTGLNYFNVFTPVFNQKNKFIDNEGNVIDNILVAEEGSPGMIWVGNAASLLLWDSKTGIAKNVTPTFARSHPPDIETSQAAGICRDQFGNMWASFNGIGLARYNPEGKLLNFFRKENVEIPSNLIRIIRLLSNGKLLIGAEDGLFLMDPLTLKSDTLGQLPALAKIRKKRIVDIMPDGNKIWIACSPRGGAYCYDMSNNTLFTAKGLSSDRVYSLGKDDLGNIYIGTFEGLNILRKDGSIRVIDKSNGLLHLRVDNIVKDSLGRMWITNFATLIRYNPYDSSFAYFDRQNGVSNSGFTISQSGITAEGKMLFCNTGLLIVDPYVSTDHASAKPQVIINRTYDDGGFDLLPSNYSIEMPYNKSKISFYYLINNLFAANRFLFRYKMTGLDTSWQQPTKNSQVTYNLKPGKYNFQIQTSYNEGSWKDAPNQIQIVVHPPFWQTWWFRVLVLLTIAGIFYLLYRRRVRIIKDRAAIKQQMTELEGKALRAQMNPHFIFNSLNAIQELVVTKNFDEGYQYLSNFSKLLRQVLNNSEKNTVALSAELEMIRLQLSLESLRFKKSFNYHIEVSKGIDPEMINVPPLLLQPYVENAVWHGLRHKEGEKNLWVRVKEDAPHINIEIEDNGIGRKKAEEIKKQKLGAEQFESKGTALSQQRIKILNDLYPGKATVTFVDLHDEMGKAVGTKVIINLPYNLG